MSSYTLGIDYGTNSVRAVVFSCENGEEIGAQVFNYPSGDEGVLVDPKDDNLARQHPGDYIEGLAVAVTGAIQAARASDGFSPDRVIGIGVDTTASTPMPVNEKNEPLGVLPDWKDNLAAQAWLWKDHTSADEAARITGTAREHRPHYLAKCGEVYSSEWFWSKVWHCLNTSPDVFDAAHSWVELADFIPAVLTGKTRPEDMRRGVCAAGHKALYAEDWNGLPDKQFLGLLDPKLASLRDRLYEKAYDLSESAGGLCSEWAERLGLPEGIPVAIGAIDAHFGAVGAGVREGVLVKILGTSACDITVAALERQLPDIPGIAGIVNGSVLPGFYGIEAGQAAVGDIFNWFVKHVCRGDGSLHESLTAEAEKQKPGESGLLALDWNNGNRNVLIDPNLTGLLAGQTLHTTQADIYRALIEGTAFGARAIIERLREYDVPIERIVCCGGIAEKNPMLMQIYADVTNCTMQVARSGQAPALGSAISAAVAAGKANGGYDDFVSAQDAMTGVQDTEYQPDPANLEVYNKLYSLYRIVHDGFGGVSQSVDVSGIMKELLEIKRAQRGGEG